MSPPRQSFLAADRGEWAASSSGYWSLVLNIPITWCTATGINLCTNMATVFIFRIGWKLSSVFKRECKLFIISCSLISLISAEYRSLQLSAVIDKKLMFCCDQSVSSYKVLGLTLCDTLKWNDNTSDIVSKASAHSQGLEARWGPSGGPCHHLQRLGSLCPRILFRCLGYLPSSLPH